MTLATRCSACGTSFRVVQDQLKVSGGWVRCGRCNEVFNAIEGLYEVGSPMAEPARRAPAPASASPPPSPSPAAAIAPPPPAPPLPAPPSPTSWAPTEPAAFTADDLPAAARVDVDAGADIEPAGADRPEPAPRADASEPHAPPVPSDVEIDRVDRPDGAASIPTPEAAAPSVAPTTDDRSDMSPPAAQDGDDIDSEPLHAQDELRPLSAPEEDDLLVPSPADEWHSGDWPKREPVPSFMIQAERAERRRHPRARLFWSLSAAALTLALMAQVALAYRDVLAARWPASRSTLAAACAPLGCSVEPLRHIAALSVEASGLQQLGSAPVYALTLTLRNRGELELMAPAVDLVLTDSQGRTLVRRVLTTADLGRPSRTLGPRSEWSGQATLSVAGQRISGYTIEIFYP